MAATAWLAREVAVRLHSGLSPIRLRVFLALLFIALAVPSAVLIEQTRQQLKWEAFHQYRTLADELGLRIDAELQRMIASEERRGYADYSFVVLAGDPDTANFLQRSPLARFPVQSEVPGLLGYFQIDVEGAFSTPLLPRELADPARWGLGRAELAQRIDLRDRLLEVLRRNQLIGPQAVASATDALVAANRDAPLQNQQAFDQLNAPQAQAAQAPQSRQLARVDELPLAKNYQRQLAAEQTGQAPPVYEQKLKSNVQQRTKRTEQTAVLEPPAAAGTAPSPVDARQVRIFESEVDPFEFNLLGDGRGVLYRKVWRNGQRTIQGAVIDQQQFLDGAMVKAFEETALAQMSDLAIAYRHDVVRFARSTAAVDGSDRAPELRGELLHQVRLSAPFGDFRLLWNINQLPAAAGGKLLLWSAGVLLSVLVLGFALLYRLGMKLILLARQQQDFVSAVSHELNTPLTSIRMYAEMLSAGWASDDKKREYYRFIEDESQRLSRLIANVLQLARMERNELRLEIRPVSVDSLIDVLRSKLEQQIERAGFGCQYAVPDQFRSCTVLADVDAFVQIMINLVDNALKFSARCERRELEISVRNAGADALGFCVRDFGPGVDKAQLGKIFSLFYRPGSELTRDTPGTGIGLALVRQMARAMGGEVDVANRDPGAEFRLVLPLARTPRAPPATLPKEQAAQE